MKNINDLEKVLPKDILADVNDLLITYANNTYDYLAVSIKDWENLFFYIINDMLNEKIDLNNFIEVLTKRVDLKIRNFILNEINSGNVRILNNLLFKLNNNTYSSYFVIIMFFKELKYLNIKFNNSIYDLMKKDSDEFKKLLNYFNIYDLSYEEFLKYVNNIFEKIKKNRISNFMTTKLAKILPVRIKVFYDKFANFMFVSEVEKRTIISYLFNNLAEASQDLIINYCKDSLEEKDIHEAEGIIASMKALYGRFIMTGEVLDYNITLKELYETISKRKNALEKLYNFDVDFSKVYAKLGINNLKRLGERLNLLKMYYLDKGYTYEYFLKKLEDVITLLEEEPNINEEDYVLKFLNIFFEELNNGVTRV